jgi:hypothetical protein
LLALLLLLMLLLLLVVVVVVVLLLVRLCGWACNNCTCMGTSNLVRLCSACASH